MSFSSRLREITRKYGKVALGVHLSVSAASITGLYVAVRNNVDVDALFQKAGLSSPSSPPPSDSDPTPPSNDHPRNRTAELAASSGGALAVAILLNKALFPVRVPITIALTPPISRFLRKRNLLKDF